MSTKLSTYTNLQLYILSRNINKLIFYCLTSVLVFSLSGCIDEYRLVNITSVDIEVKETSSKKQKVGKEIVLEGSYTYKGAGHHSDFKWTITDPTTSESWTIEKPRLILKPEISGVYKIELEVIAEVDEFIDHETTDISLIINP